MTERILHLQPAASHGGADTPAPAGTAPRPAASGLPEPATGTTPLLRLVAFGAVLLAGLLLLPADAQAQRDRWSSPISNAVEIKFSPYTPNIDREFEGPGPWSEVFDGGSVLVELEYNRQFYRGFGSLGIGFNLGWFGNSAGSLTEEGERAADRTRFDMMPMRTALVYRFDVLQNEFNIPFVLSAKGGFTWALWWVGDGSGGATFAERDGSISRGRGGTLGYHGEVGLHFLLNSIAPGMARSFDANHGINHSYLFAEYLFSRIDDFGSSSSWDLGDNTFTFGVGFEF